MNSRPETGPLGRHRVLIFYCQPSILERNKDVHRAGFSEDYQLLSKSLLRTGLVLTATLVLVAACEKTAVPPWKIPVTTSSQDALEYFLEGRDLALSLRSAEARTRFQSAIERDSSFALAYLEMARYAPSAKMFQEYLARAIDLADHVSEGERLSIEAVHANSIEGRPQKARNIYLELVEMYPKDELAHFRLAVHYFIQKDYKSCLSVCDVILSISPDFAPLFNLLGYTHQALGDYEAAESSFKRYIELNPAEPNPYDSYADLLLKTGRFEEAIDMYEQALEISPGFSASVRGIASALNALGQNGEARKKLYDVLDRFGPAPVVSEAIAISYIEQRMFDSATIVLDSARQHQLGRADTITVANLTNRIGDVYLESGRTKDAKYYYQQAITTIQNSGVDRNVKENSSIQYQYALARVAIAEGKLDSAEVLAELHLQTARERVDPAIKSQAYFLKAAIAMERGQWDKALGHCEMTDPHDPYHQFQKSTALRRAGRIEESDAILLKATSANLKQSLPLAFVRAHASEISQK